MNDQQQFYIVVEKEFFLFNGTDYATAMDSEKKLSLFTNIRAALDYKRHLQSEAIKAGYQIQYSHAGKSGQRRLYELCLTNRLQWRKVIEVLTISAHDNIGPLIEENQANQ